MEVFSEITVARDTPGLVAAVTQYLIDGDTPFLIRPQDYEDSIIVRMQVLGQLDPQHLIRQIERQVPGGQIQLYLGAVQKIGSKVFELSDIFAKASKLFPNNPSPEQVWHTTSARPEYAAKLLAGEIGRQVEAPTSWQEIQELLRVNEVLVGSIITREPVAQTPDGAGHASVSIRVNDSQTWKMLQGLIKHGPFELLQYHAVNPEALQWVSTGQAVEVQGLDPNTVLDHHPEDKPDDD